MPLALLITAPVVVLLRPSAPVGASEIAVRPAGLSRPGPAAGEAYAWRHVAIGGGGFITGLAFDPTGTTRLARTDTYGAYRWQDSRWHQLVDAASMPPEDRHQNGASEGVYEIVVAPSAPDRLYMAINGWVYRSDNRGSSWRRTAADAATNTPFPFAADPNGPYRMYGPFMAVDPHDPDLLLIGTPTAGLLRSTDGGGHWMRVVGIPLAVPFAKDAGDRTAARHAPGALIWFAPGAAGGGIWIAVPGAGLFVSRDNGASFAPFAPQAARAPVVVRRGSFAPDGTFYAVESESKRAWRYRGGTWTDLTAAGALPALNFAAVAADPRGPDVFVFDEGGQTYRSTDGGASWSRVLHRSVVGSGDPSWLHVANQSYFATADVVFDPVLPHRLWSGAGTGVYYAEPLLGGLLLQWVSEARGIEQLVTTDIVQPPGQAPAFAAWDFGIHVKPDLDAYSTTYGPAERVVIAAQQLAWTPANPRFLVTNASDTRMDCCSEDGRSVLAGYSEDGGRSWTRFASLPRPPGTRADDPWRMAFGMIAVAADDPNSIIWAPSFNRSPFYTRDRGRSWTRVVLPGEVLPNTGSHAQLYLPRKTLVADRVLPGRFYYLHSGDGANAALQGVWRTDDGGAHWVRVFTGEVAPSSQYAAKLRAVPGKPGHLFFTTGIAEGPDTEVRRSFDGGARWTTLTGVDHVDDIAFGKAAFRNGYPTIFLSGRVKGAYGIWRSTDDARSWQQLAQFPAGTLDQVSAIEADKDVFGRVYLGYKGSGWIYGQPSLCRPAPYVSGSGQSCAAVAP